MFFTLECFDPQKQKVWDIIKIISSTILVSLQLIKPKKAKHVQKNKLPPPPPRPCFTMRMSERWFWERDGKFLCNTTKFSISQWLWAQWFQKGLIVFLPRLAVGREKRLIKIDRYGHSEGSVRMHSNRMRNMYLHFIKVLLHFQPQRS